MTLLQPSPCRFGALLVLSLCALWAPASAMREVVDLMDDPDSLRINGVDIGDSPGRVAACDVNGDGIDDLLIGAAGADGPSNTRPVAGEVYVVYGRRGTWSGSIELSNADVRIIGQESFDELDGVACGDVNGDGFGDLVLGADEADSIDNSRNQAGQIHIVFGGPSLPAFIDLATSPGTLLYGAVPEGILGFEPTVGDVNGDGLLDVIAGAGHAVDKSGTVINSGRVHILFGRPVWPATIDLLTGSDVTIYGHSGNSLGDSLGLHTAVGPLDGGPIDDLVIVAQAADGPADTRDGAGAVLVFRGRAVWPAEIDLAVEPSDMLIHGADAGDQIGGSTRAVGLGDLDSDGLSDLVIGAFAADGRDNNVNVAGEVQVYQPGGILPPVIDLLTDGKSVVRSRR